MSEDSQNHESDGKEYTSRLYNCPKCNSIHTIKLPRDIAKNKPIFPFPFVFLHSSEDNLEDLLTVLYIDVQLHIRAVEVIEVENSNIFSENLTKQITEKLMDKIIGLEQENLHLKDLLNKLEIEKFSEIENENPKVSSIPNLENKSEIKAQPISLEPLTEKLKEIESQSYIKPVNIRSQRKETKSYIDVFIISIITPGKKIQDLTINLDTIIKDLKKTIGHMYGLLPANFHLSYGGITFDERLYLKDYNLENGDEILIIP